MGKAYTVDDAGNRHEIKDVDPLVEIVKKHTKVKHQGWVASLSNGETIFQEPNVSGERTAWGKLQARCEEEEIHITQIQLQLHGITLVGMANADGYTSFYDRAQSWSQRDDVAIYQGIGSVLGDWVTCMFTNESGHVWHDLRQLSVMREHCQLKPAIARRPLMARPLELGSQLASVQAIDISDQEELSDKEFDRVSAWFRDEEVWDFYGNKDDEYVAYAILKITGIKVSPEEVADFKLALWS